MRHTLSRAATLAAFVTLLLASPSLAQNNRRATAATPAAAATAAPEISFTVSMPRPHTHMLDVEMRVRQRAGAPAQTDLVMPVWTPGSYLVREFARNVQDFAAVDANNRPLQWGKINKNTWRVQTGGAREVRATYRVYANEFSVRTNEVTDQHAFWNNTALLMYVDGQLAAPSTVRVVPFGNWKVATGLPPVGGQANTFRAENFDVLYDSPFEVSNFKTLTFDVKGVPHRIVIDGEGNYDPERLRADVQKVAETTVELMGGEVPYRDYTFILHTRSTGGGGLEHLNSTALIWPRFNFRPDARYKDFLGLVAHEFFHLWNVKRIRPDALGPFDYTGENYTKLLWVAEGVTNYYETLILRRAGLISEREYLDTVGDQIASVQTKPGRLVMSAEEASFDAWIKYYRPDENAVNSQISYYDKGGLLGMLLDLEIRRRSNNQKSLDDVMRYLYTEFAKRNRNYTPEDFQRACELMAGGSLEQFFARYVRGRDELPYDEILAHAGLRLETSAGEAARPEAQRAYLGADVEQEGDRLVVRRVYSGTPAYDQGLSAGDQIVALNNMRVNREGFNQRLAERRPGENVIVTVFRNDDLRTFNLKLGGRANISYRPVPVSQPTAEQTSLYQSWVGTTAAARSAGR